MLSVSVAEFHLSYVSWCFRQTLLVPYFLYITRGNYTHSYCRSAGKQEHFYRCHDVWAEQKACVLYSFSCESQSGAQCSTGEWRMKKKILMWDLCSIFLYFEEFTMTSFQSPPPYSGLKSLFEVCVCVCKPLEGCWGWKWPDKVPLLFHATCEANAKQECLWVSRWIQLWKQAGPKLVGGPSKRALNGCL